MSFKPPSTPELISNPFIKKRNLNWTIEPPLESTNPSPPREPSSDDPTTAAVEAGSAIVTDHLDLFTTTLSKHTIPSIPRLPITSYSHLYTSNAGSTNGAHFVIHQHDHPVAGTHYDLRLQINETSSVSWAIMYGLPGDPNSVRLNRNATETRIHCLWNHLIETASPATGSLMIWDTGTYSILPRQSKHAPATDPASPPSSPPHSPSSPSSSPQALLHEAFQERKIRLRLHGAKLPDPYILNLRLTRAEDAAGRARRPSKRRRARRRQQQQQQQPEETSDEGEREEENDEHIVPQQSGKETKTVSAMEREIQELEDEQVRRTNAYPGASNTIGSVHQRRWYLSLDRRGCGFMEGKSKNWRLDPKREAREEEVKVKGAEDCRLEFPFYVRGVDHERSIITGRKGEDILRDEGVANFVRRKGWAPVLK